MENIQIKSDSDKELCLKFIHYLTSLHIILMEEDDPQDLIQKCDTNIEKTLEELEFSIYSYDQYS